MGPKDSEPLPRTRNERGVILSARSPGVVYLLSIPGNVLTRRGVAQCGVLLALIKRNKGRAHVRSADTSEERA